MLHAISAANGAARRLSTPTAQDLAGAVWIDLQSPTDEERARVQTATALRLPAQAAVAEIETSSRLRVHHGVLYLTMPLISMAEDGATGVPAAFILSEDRLITVRFAPNRVFDAFIEGLTRDDGGTGSATHVFVGLMEAIVDRQADGLESIRDDLERISHDIFAMGIGPGAGRRKEDALLKSTLGQLGRIGDLISHIRDTQTGAARIIPYVEAMAATWLPADIHARLETLRQDIASVSEFSTHLNDKTQFLLDATLGFISIAQNNVMKVMAIASVVGIPPVMVAGIYGMNFKNMPEYDWSWGYQYGWALIILTTLIPLALFRWRKWI